MERNIISTSCQNTIKPTKLSSTCRPKCKCNSPTSNSCLSRFPHVMCLGELIIRLHYYYNKAIFFSLFSYICWLHIFWTYSVHPTNLIQRISCKTDSWAEWSCKHEQQYKTSTINTRESYGSCFPSLTHNSPQDLRLFSTVRNEVRACRFSWFSSNSKPGLDRKESAGGTDRDWTLGSDITFLFPSYLLMRFSVVDFQNTQNSVSNEENNASQLQARWHDSPKKEKVRRVLNCTNATEWREAGFPRVQVNTCWWELQCLHH